MTRFQSHIVKGHRNSNHYVLKLTIPKLYYNSYNQKLTLTGFRWAHVLRTLTELDNFNGYDLVESLIQEQGFRSNPCLPLPIIKESSMYVVRGDIPHSYFFSVKEEIKTTAWREEGDGYSWMPRLEWIHHLFAVCKRDTIAIILKKAGFIRICG